MRVSRRHSSQKSSDGSDQPSTSTGSMNDQLDLESSKVELLARLLSQIRATRDRREAQLYKQISTDNPKLSEDELREMVGVELKSINEHVQDLENRTTGILLEDLLRIPKYAVTMIEPPVSLKSPPRQEVPSSSRSPTKTLNPIEIKVEESTSNTNSAAPSHSLLSVNTAETNVEKAAKQEAQIMARIAELRRSGLWTTSRLPLCVEPPRNKTHWDYLLEEMKWMANDFRQERLFKRNMARKIAGAITKQKREQELDIEKAEQRVLKDGKRICAGIARMVRDFWQNVDKVVDFRAQEILESKKRKALDQHLAFIVGEADKLSSMVQEGLQQEKTSKTPSLASKDDQDDRDFYLNRDDDNSDDESTIAREEKASKEDVTHELNALATDADQEMDDLLASLPPEYLASLGITADSLASSKRSSATDSRPESAMSEVSKADTVEPMDSEGPQSSKSELKEEEADSSSEQAEGESSAKRRRLDDELDKLEGAEKEKTPLEGNGDGRGMLEKVDYAKLNSADSDERQQELANIAEEALKLQPKGFTLETTQVKTQVPHLIRGNLREYQMVGLDWLVTLYEKNLNGILADEMGLGKTIQTIALLAHLACSESIWGPHLIVVPTSVILNWEMELKKWCPAFKILTYFGSVKDRQEKRKGWSKPNAFHVCITSYKTVTTDIRSFKMKSWQYLILDEAQNIKNWKSQRWQALLNVRARRRLLLTGTPLQNSLMELWSLMHFLMPAIFASHDDFKDWFSNPLTGMMDGSVEFNAPLVQRLHKVLRPFILRRLKSEVERQMPSKTEHVVKCQLSKRQRYLYDDFMSKRSTRDNLKSGNMLSVLNIVMQLRKCCNHPNLFEPRPVVSPFALNRLRLTLPAMVFDICGDEARLEDRKEIPSSLDIRNRLTGWNTSVQYRRPKIEELQSHADTIEPPIVNGFKLQRPPIERADPYESSSASPSANAVMDVSAAELQRAGFGQGAMFLVVGEGDDLESLLSNSQGAPVPMRVRVDGGRAVIDNSVNGAAESTGRARLCQVVTVNGEKILRDVSSATQNGMGAAVPVTTAATAEPSAARLPGTGSAAVASSSYAFASAGPSSSSMSLSTTLKRDVYDGHPQQKRPVSVHPSLRANTVISTSLSSSTPLLLSTSTSGFHHMMANGGAREPITNYNYQFSPPLKRRRVTDSPLITGEYVECVPEDTYDSLAASRDTRLELYRSRFVKLDRPLFSHELINVLRTYIRKVDRDDESDDWQWDGWNCERTAIVEPLRDFTERLVKRFVLHIDVAQSDAIEVASVSRGRPAYSRLADQVRSAAARFFLEQSDPLTDQKLLCSRLQFPELRLIEYDCGKLQILANLLRELFLYKHRCLIFTQMSRMLDVLQAFLSFHGYQYFRLDGTTGIEQRQAMMERFNADPKIFCFILSTRSGGVGVNLTGADTVIFYDSDWNPTMDAQAQDRCHRIGQTRNVSIYRLISERTIEENILKKAMQKRRLGEMAIDEAGFTPDFFKQSDNIRDLFDGEEAASEVAASLDVPTDQKSLDKVMAAVEDEQDVAAARLANDEARADRAEFDDRVGGGNGGNGSGNNGVSEEKPDDKYMELINQLKPIERYAVNFLEAEYKPDFEEEVKETEAQIEQKKEDWQRAHEKAMAADEAGENAEGVDDFYGYGSMLDEILADGPDVFDELMPSWAPPTPPLSDDDVYYDDCLDLLYDPDFMGEARLPSTIYELHRPLMKPPSPVKRASLPSSGLHHNSSSQVSSAASDQAVLNLLHSIPQQNHNNHHHHLQNSSGQYGGDSGYHHHLHQPYGSSSNQLAGGSGSNYPSNCNSPLPFADAYDFNMTNFPDIKTEEPFANISVAPRKEKSSSSSSRRMGERERQHQQQLLRAVTPPPPQREEMDYEGPEWSIVEDKAMLEAVRNEERMKHTIERLKSALHYNWEYISGYVNRVTGFYRSPRQCSIRYQVTVRPREAGQLVAMDPLTKKHKKVPLTQAEVVHLRKGRVTTDMQYEAEMGKLLEERVRGRVKVIRKMTEKSRPAYKRSVENVSIDALNGRLPSGHEARLLDLGVHFSTNTTLMAEDLIRIQEERHSKAAYSEQQHQQRKKANDRHTDDLRGRSPLLRTSTVTIRPPAVPAGPGTVISKAPFVLEVPAIHPIRSSVHMVSSHHPGGVGGQPSHPGMTSSSSATGLHEHQMQSSSTLMSLQSTNQQQQPVGGLTRRVASVGGAMQHLVQQQQQQQPAGQQGQQGGSGGVGGGGTSNYVVVGHDAPQGASAIRVQRQEAGGGPGQPMFRSLVGQARRTSPATPLTGARGPIGYVTSSQAGQVSSSSTFISSQQGGGTTVYAAGGSGQGIQQGVAQRQQTQGRVMARGGRMFMTPSGTIGERTYVMQHPQPQLRMLPNQSRQTRPARYAQPPGPMTTMVMQGRPSQIQHQQIRTVPRGGPLPAGSRIMNVVMAPSSQQLRASGQILQGGGVSMTRQLLTSRMAPSRQSSPQTAQVVIAPPTSMQQQHHSLHQMQGGGGHQGSLGPSGSSGPSSSQQNQLTHQMDSTPPSLAPVHQMTTVRVSAAPPAASQSQTVPVSLAPPPSSAPAPQTSSAPAPATSQPPSSTPQ